MKLYTENQMKDAIIESFLSTYPTNGDDILSKIKPIELPSSEEIDKEASTIFIFGADQGKFIAGAQWVLDQIKQQDK